MNKEQIIEKIEAMKSTHVHECHCDCCGGDCPAHPQEKNERDTIIEEIIQELR